jgi:hypothetical protein
MADMTDEERNYLLQLNDTASKYGQRSQDNKIHRAAIAYCSRTQRFAKDNHLAYDEHAVYDALINSDLWVAWATEGGERPIVFRNNRNHGYIRGNLHLGTEADRQRFRQLHFEQRRELAKTHLYAAYPRLKPNHSKPGQPFTWSSEKPGSQSRYVLIKTKTPTGRTKLTWKKRPPTEDDLRAIADRRRAKRSARQQRWRIRKKPPRDTPGG